MEMKEVLDMEEVILIMIMEMNTIMSHHHVPSHGKLNKIKSYTC